MEMMTEQAILRPPEAAAYIGLSESTLAKRRLRGELPVFVKLGVKAIGYRRQDLDSWLEQSRRRSTTEMPESL